jgi:predicted transcriptional regulator
MGLEVNDGFYVKLPNHIWSRMKFQCRTALWLYMWLIDKTTEEEEVDGELHGLVLGGTPLSYKDIGKYVGVSWSTVQRQVQVLVEGNYIRIYPGGTDGRYRYHVADSYKFNKRLDDKKAPLTRSEELQQKLKDGRIVANPSGKVVPETAAVAGWEAEKEVAMKTSPESDALAKRFWKDVMDSKEGCVLPIWSALFFEYGTDEYERLIDAVINGDWKAFIQTLKVDPVEWVHRHAVTIKEATFWDSDFFTPEYVTSVPGATPDGYRLRDDERDLDDESDLYARD